MAKLFPLLLFLLWLLIYFTIAFKANFVDEIDNWVGGRQIVASKVIYTDFFSHHAPLPYFLAALTALTSPRDFAWFRLPLLILYCLAFWAVIQLTAKPIHKPLTIVWWLLIFFAPVFHTQMLLGESLVALSLSCYLLLLFSYEKYEKPNTPLLILALIVCSWITVWSVPTYIPAVLIFTGFTSYLMIRKKAWHWPSKRVLMLGVILWFFFPLYLFFTGSHRGFFWSVFSYNTSYYYPSRLSAGSSSGFIIDLVTGPLIFLTQSIQTSVRNHWQLALTLKTSLTTLTPGHTQTFIPWIGVGLTWWWDRMNESELLFFNLLCLSFFMLMISLVGKNRNKWPWVCFMVTLLWSLRLRATEMFHLLPFYLVASTGMILFIFALIQHRYFGRATILIGSGLIFVFTEIKPTFDLIRSQPQFIAPEILVRSQSLDNAQNFRPATHLLNLTGNMSYFLTTSLLPANRLLYFHPWFYAAPQLKLEVETTINEHGADLILTDNQLETYAPDLVYLIRQNYRELSPHLYIYRD